MKRLNPKQLQMLRDYADAGEATDLGDFHGHLGWHNRERMIGALQARGFVSQLGEITQAGREHLESLKPKGFVVDGTGNAWNVTEDELLEARRRSRSQDVNDKDQEAYFQLVSYGEGRVFYRDEAARGLQLIRGSKS